MNLLDLYDQAARDPCASKHGGNPNSVAAFESIAPALSESEGRVLAAVEKLGDATIHEVCDLLGVTPNQISGRFTSLVAKKRLRIVGTRKSPSRNACGVYAAVKSE